MITSNVCEDTRKKANLRVLQRLDPSIEDITCSATHVVLYEFSQSNQAWEKKNIEGSLFIVSSSSSSSYKAIILNRNSINNLVVPIVREFQMQVKEPYLIFRDSISSHIRGLWFHDGNERTYVSKCLNGVVEQLKKDGDSDNNNVTTSDSANDSADCHKHEQDVVSAISSLCINDNNVVGVSSDDNDSSKPTTEQEQEQVVLDKKNLQLTLMSLMQDERFLDLLHAQYVKVCNARNKKGNEKEQT